MIAPWGQGAYGVRVSERLGRWPSPRGRAHEHTKETPEKKKAEAPALKSSSLVGTQLALRLVHLQLKPHLRAEPIRRAFVVMYIYRCNGTFFWCQVLQNATPHEHWCLGTHCYTGTAKSLSPQNAPAGQEEGPPFPPGRHRLSHVQARATADAKATASRGFPYTASLLTLRAVQFLTDPGATK